jgi:hypothetical protein
MSLSLPEISDVSTCAYLRRGYEESKKDPTIKESDMKHRLTADMRRNAQTPLRGASHIRARYTKFEFGHLKSNKEALFLEQKRARSGFRGEPWLDGQIIRQ